MSEYWHHKQDESVVYEAEKAEDVYHLWRDGAYLGSVPIDFFEENYIQSPNGPS